MAAAAGRVTGGVWARNSYALGYLEPGFSDLDITLYSKIESEQANSFLRFYAWLKIFLPFLGEINFYTDRKIEQLKIYANSFEISRDPKLQELMQTSGVFSRYEAAVFLLRQIEKDFNQIERFPHKRIKKWKFHYQQMILIFPELEISSKVPFDPVRIRETILLLILQLCNIRNPVLESNALQSLEFYLELSSRNFNFYKISPSGFSDPWFFCWAFPKLQANQVYPVKLTEDQNSFIECQFTWEICGYLSQTASANSEIQFRSHLLNLDRVIAKLNARLQSEDVQNFVKKLKLDGWNQ